MIQVGASLFGLGVVIAFGIFAVFFGRVAASLVHRIWRAGYDPNRRLALALTLVRFVLMCGWLALALALVLLPTFESWSPIVAASVAGGLILASLPAMQNVIAGLYLSARGDLREGDAISIGGTVGTVREVGLGRLRLRKDDGTTALIPNRLLLREPVEVQRASGRARIDVTLDDRVYEASDIVKIRQVALLCPYRVASTPVHVHYKAGEVRVQLQTWRPRCHEEVLYYLSAMLDPMPEVVAETETTEES